VPGNWCCRCTVVRGESETRCRRAMQCHMVLVSTERIRIRQLPYDPEQALVANQYPSPSQRWCLELARTGEPHAIEIRPCGSGTNGTSYPGATLGCEVQLSPFLQGWCAWILWMPKALGTRVAGRYLRLRAWVVTCKGHGGRARRNQLGSWT